MDSDADVALMKLGPAVWVSGKQFDISHFVPTTDDAASRLSPCQWVLAGRKKTRKVAFPMGIDATKKSIYEFAVPRAFKSALRPSSFNLHPPLTSTPEHDGHIS
jgi:hypothetical protein